MTEKRILIIPTELAKRLDDNRGDMSQADFINFLIDSLLKPAVKDEQFVIREEFISLAQAVEDQQLATNEKLRSLREGLKEDQFATKEEFLSLKQTVKDQQVATKEELLSLKERLNNGQQFATKEEMSSLMENIEAQKFVTKEEFLSLDHDVKKLLRSFLDFFISYGLELGTQTPVGKLEELNYKLEELEKDLVTEGSSEKKAKIKWK